MANYFIGDPNCVALYRFEPGAALIVDTIGGNNLNSSNQATSRTSTYMEGIGCVDFERASPYAPLYREDADLAANFPWKNSGAERDFTICTWFREESLPGVGLAHLIFAKTDYWNYGYRLITKLQVGSKWYPGVRYSTPSGSQDVSLGAGIIDCFVNQWCHICVAYRHSTKTWRWRLYNSVTGQTGTSEYNANYQMVGNTCPITVGNWWSNSVAKTTNGDLCADSYIDELVIFNRFLPFDEMALIQQGNYVIGVQVTPSPAIAIGHGLNPLTLISLPANWKSGWFGLDRPRRYKEFRYGRLVAHGAGFLVSHEFVDHEAYRFANPLATGPAPIASGRIDLNRKSRLHSYDIRFPDIDADSEILHLSDNYILRSER